MSDLSPVTGCGHQCRSYVDRRDNRVNHHVNKDAKGKLLVRLPFFPSESKGLLDERSNLLANSISKVRNRTSAH